MQPELAARGAKSNSNNAGQPELKNDQNWWNIVLKDKEERKGKAGPLKKPVSGAFPNLSRQGRETEEALVTRGSVTSPLCDTF